MSSLTSQSMSYIIPYCGRRDSAKRSSQPWTTGRCHRLLRPLLSQVAQLRRIVQLHSDLRSEVLVAASNITAQKRTLHDLDVNVPRKKLRHKYSSKGSRKRPGPEPSASAPTTSTLARLMPQTGEQAEMLVPRSVLRRARGQKSSPVKGPEDSPSRGPKPRQRRSFPIDRHLPESHELSLGLEKILDDLLRATDPALSPQRLAPKSFLAMCIRKVPEYISALELQEKEEAGEELTRSPINQPTASLRTYLHLESLAAFQPHLRAVTRAHGINIIENAILDGSLRHSEAIMKLISVCRRLGARIEAEQLLDAMTTVLANDFFGPQTPGRPYLQAQQCLTRINRASLAHRFCVPRPSTQIRFGTALLNDDRFPAWWVFGCEAAGIVQDPFTHALRAISRLARQEDDFTGCDQELNFINKSFARLCRSGGTAEETRQHIDKKPSTLFIRVLAGITALLVSARQGAKKPINSHQEDQQDAPDIIRRRLAWITKIRFLEDAACADELVPDCYSFLLGLPFLLTADVGMDSSPEEDFVHHKVKQAWQNIMRSHDQLALIKDYVPRVISKAALSCGDGDSAVPRMVWGDLCNNLEGFDPFNNLVPRLKAQALFALAESTHNIQDLAFAEELYRAQNGTATDLAETQTLPAWAAASQSRFGAYIWEEGISEWVMADADAESRNPSEVVRETLDSIQRQKHIITRSRMKELEVKDEARRDSLVGLARISRRSSRRTTSSDPDFSSDEESQGLQRSGGRRSGQRSKESSLLSLVSDEDEDDDLDELLGPASGPINRTVKRAGQVEKLKRGSRRMKAYKSLPADYEEDDLAK
jgi:hypothetical protein